MSRFCNYTSQIGLLYLLSIFIIIPELALFGGRVNLPCFRKEQIPLQPANIGYCLLARNYVNPELRSVVERIAAHMSKTHPETRLTYLDANFPFLNGFPLLPHLVVLYR
jgi:hypothetical protein